jgi:hypothetical protein
VALIPIDRAGYTQHLTARFTACVTNATVPHTELTTLGFSGSVPTITAGSAPTGSHACHSATDPASGPETPAHYPAGS